MQGKPGKRLTENISVSLLKNTKAWVLREAKKTKMPRSAIVEGCIATCMELQKQTAKLVKSTDK
jgi:hypothetical protein